MIEMYRKETIDIEDVGFEEYDLEFDTLFPDKEQAADADSAIQSGLIGAKLILTVNKHNNNSINTRPPTINIHSNLIHALSIFREITAANQRRKNIAAIIIAINADMQMADCMVQRYVIFSDGREESLL